MHGPWRRRQSEGRGLGGDMTSAQNPPSPLRSPPLLFLTACLGWDRKPYIAEHILNMDGRKVTQAAVVGYAIHATFVANMFDEAKW